MTDRTKPLDLRTRRRRSTTGTAGVLQQRRVRKSRRVGLLRCLEVPGDTCEANTVNNNKL